LIEVLLTLALILILGSLVVYNVGNLHRMRDERPLEEVLLNAVREARYQAAFNKEVCWLSYDVETSTFRISIDSQAPIPALPSERSAFTATVEEEEQPMPALATLEVFVREEEESPKVEFLAVPPGKGFDGGPDDEPEDFKLTRVPFDPAGFSVPFTVKLDFPQEELRKTVAFDPFSNHVLDPEDVR